MIWKTNFDQHNKMEYKRSLDNYRQVIMGTKAAWFNQKIEDAANKSKESWNIVNLHRENAIGSFAVKNLKLRKGNQILVKPC